MRVSAKLFLLDPGGRLLLLDCTDPARPGSRWQELPGGGVEPGEDPVSAVVREVREETGLRVPPGLVGPLQWTQDASFLFRGRARMQHHEGRLARLTAPPQPGPPALDAGELGAILGWRWWTPAELGAHPGRFFPRSVPELVGRLAAGERVDEPFDAWDGPAGGGPPLPAPST